MSFNVVKLLIFFKPVSEYFFGMKIGKKIGIEEFSDIHTAYKMCIRDRLKHYFMDKLDYINKQLEGVEKKTLYFEYRREGNTTIPGNFFYYMVEYAGADNVFKDSQNVEVESEAVIAANPERCV